MKKFLSVILACSMILSLAGCAGSNTSSKTGYGADIPTEPTNDVIEDYINGLTGGSTDTAPTSPESGVPTDTEPTTPATTAAVAAGSATGDLTAADKGEEIGIAPEYPTEGDFDISYDAVADAIGGAFEPVAGGAMDDFAYVEGEVYDEYIEEGCIDIECFPEEPPVFQPGAGQLTAGEWNDNENWNDWVSLYQTHEDWESYREHWEIDFDVRHEIIVTAFGEPLEGAQVTQRGCGNIGVTSAVTDNQGRAYLFLEECGDDMEHTIEVTYGEVRTTIENVDPTSSGTYTVDFENSSLSQGEVGDVEALDLMLMIDTTGSMWDELAYIQMELENVIKRVKEDNENIPVRVSVNFYRDEYDDYIIREFEFTDDIEQVLSDLAAQSADGGGDTPEAVHTALNSAVKEHDWNDNSTKLMFFVLDAPPHSEEQIIDEVNDYVEIAAAQGIRVIPVASSGIDKSTEYLLRTMAFRTGGTYTFLTDHSGIGGSHIEPTIGDYEVEKLNDLMVRVISEYLE